MDTFTELTKVITHKKYQMPIETDEDCIFRSLDRLFRSYVKDLEGKIDSNYHKKIKKTCDGIIECICKYYSGYISQAYSIFKDEVGEVLQDNYVFYNKSIEGSDYIDPLELYRVRKYKDDEKFTVDDIFHVPYDKRRYVSSSRFSIAGYPSLYLGTSVDLSRIESGIRKNESGIVSRFKLNRNYTDTNVRIRVLDLAIKPIDILEGRNYFSIDNLNNLKMYLYMYPLIAACSVMAKSRGVPFIPEYIVPQMLMQWLREKSSDSEITGVRYFTCRTQNPRIKGYNYVFPVTYIANRNADSDNKFCQVLAKCFRLTYPEFYNSFGNPTEIENKLFEKRLISKIKSASKDL